MLVTHEKLTADESRTATVILAIINWSLKDELSGADIQIVTGIPTGRLYPILLRLESIGWLESRWEKSDQQRNPRRRLYRITPLGMDVARA
jgi:DNA-binding PadR family transcriptional regulator